MNPYAIQAADVIALQVEQGSACPQITWNGKTYPVLPNLSENNQALRAGGFVSMFDVRFTIVVSQWLTNTITNATQLAAVLNNTPFQMTGGLQGGLYKFASVKILSGGTMLDCGGNASNQNA